MITGDDRTRMSTIPLRYAVSIVVATAPFGYLLGSLFTVHLVAPEPVAVWLTTVVVAVLGLLLWSLRSSSTHD